MLTWNVTALSLSLIVQTHKVALLGQPPSRHPAVDQTRKILLNGKAVLQINLLTYLAPESVIFNALTKHLKIIHPQITALCYPD